MANNEISSITLPSGNTYGFKDAQAREAIAALEGGSYFLGVTTTALTDDSTTNPIIVDGESVTAVNGNMVVYGKKEFVFNGTKWIEFGDLSTLGALATKDTVTLNKGAGDKVLGSDATFNTTVTPATTNIKATVSGAAVSTDTDNFVKSYPGESSKMVTTSVPNVTNVGTLPSLSMTIGSGADEETLVVSWSAGSTPTLGTAITAATGSLAANGGGASVMTGLGTASTGAAVTSAFVSTQPTVSLSTGAAAGTGVISVATGISSATTTTNSKDEVTVAKYADLSVTVS